MRNCWLAITPALLTAAAVGTAAGDWPAYRGPTADGHAASDDHPPVRWSESENVRWKTAVHGKGWSSPVILGLQVWMTTATEDGKQLFAVCVDANSGKVVHDVKVFDNAAPAYCHPFNSHASCTPTIEAGRVYVHYGSVGTASLDAITGRVVWERRDLPCNHYRGPGSSPILYRDLLVVPFDGVDAQYVVGLDKYTGRTVWKTDRRTEFPDTIRDHHKAYCTPTVFAVNGRDELVCPGAVATMAYDPASGRELWRVTTGGMNSGCRPFMAEGLIVLTNGSRQLLVVRPGGAGDVTDTHVPWTYARGAPARSSPIAVENLLYFVNEGGVLTAVEMATGKEVKKVRLGGEYSASPVHAGGHLYFFDQNGAGHVVRPGRDFEIVAVNRLTEGCMASPAAIGKALFVRTRSHLYRLEAP